MVAGFEPKGGSQFDMNRGPKPVRREKARQLRPVCQFIAKANPTPASKLAFVIMCILSDMYLYGTFMCLWPIEEEYFFQNVIVHKIATGKEGLVLSHAIQ